jgi:predicted neuraminidase
MKNNHCNSQRTKNIDARRHFVREWVEDNILKIIFTPTLENTADIFTKNPTEEIFQKHAVKLVRTIPKGTEMCNVTTFPSQDIIFESQQNKVMRRNIMKAKGRDKSPPSNALVRAIFDSKEQKINMLKPITRLETKSAIFYHIIFASSEVP